MDHKWLMERVSDDLYKFVCWEHFTNIGESVQVSSISHIYCPVMNSEYQRLPETLRVLVDNVFRRDLASVLVIRGPNTILVLPNPMAVDPDPFYDVMVGVFNDSLDGIHYQLN